MINLNPGFRSFVGVNLDISRHELTTAMQRLFLKIVYFILTKNNFFKKFKNW